jgi:LCP family protein required for cell wall assembly
MKPTEIEPIGSGSVLNTPPSDRLVQVLIWVAFFLAAALAALVTDLWFWPAADPNGDRVVQASEPTPLFPTFSASATPLPAEPSATDPLPPTDLPVVLAATITPVTPPPCVPPDDWGIHIVQPGNTLYSLARRYGTDVETLMYVNCLNTYTIFIDQRLYVPGPPATATLPLPPATASPAATSAAAPSETPQPGASATPVREPLAQSTLPPTNTPRSSFKINIPNNYLNIVLLGSDKRPQSQAWRTDSMIVVSVDMDNNIVRLLSIPRDLWVDIPGHGQNRINTADLWGELAKKGGGPERVKQTIYHNLGIPIHYYVRVDFQGFIEIIDTVGGVDIDVDCPLSDINLSAGMHHMTGQQALRYSRSRKSTNDFDRGRRQRKVLMALWEQALSLDIIPKLPSLWRTMAESFETDLPLDQVINLAYVGAQLRPQRILSKAIGPRQVQGWITPQGAAVLLPREDRIRDLLESFYAPQDPNKLDRTEKLRVRVLNGSSRRDAEELAAAALRWEGFKVAGTGLADRRDYGQSSILVYNGDQASGEQVAQALNLPAAAVQLLTGVDQPDPGQPVDVQVILGSNYNPCNR